jgi:glycosyltransferase involved in cell wall biosynthesis
LRRLFQPAANKTAFSSTCQCWRGDPGLKIAFVVSWLNQHGGAERVLEAAHELYPDAPVYTSIYAPQSLPPIYRRWDIRASFLNRFPSVHRHHQLYLPFYPLAFESLDLRAYEVVLSIPSAFAHGVLTSSSTRHICYCLTPARFLWQYREYVENEAIGRPARLLLPLLVSRLRQWDRLAAERVDEFIAISRVVQSRIAKFYRRRSTIIYPPVTVTDFQPVPDSQVGEYFLILSRLVPYKRVDLAVKAFNQLGLPLVIAGDGRDRARLGKMAGPNIRFAGRVSDAERRSLMARCCALIFPGEEDFGITPLEANASGRPAIAFAGGGALDTIVEGLNGVFFREPTAASLAERIRTFDASAFDPRELVAHAARFDVDVFQQRLLELIEGKPAPISSPLHSAHQLVPKEDRRLTTDN